MHDESVVEQQVSETETSPTSEDGCFHCGLPVPENIDVPCLEVFGDERCFCCHGCRAVCNAIIDAGLDDYYRHRSEKAVSASQNQLPELLDRLELYDRPEIQREYIQHVGEECETALLIDGIRCPACVWLNEKRLRALPGVLDVHIDDNTHRARVRWDQAQTKLSTILGAISGIGYTALPYDAERNRALRKERNRRSIERLIFAGAAGMLVMEFSLATYLMADTSSQQTLPMWVSIGRWTSLLVCLTILAYPGQDFFVGAWRDIKNRRAGMDIPICLGLGAALLGSLYATITHTGEVYYDSIAMFVFFLLLARRWEMQAKFRAAGNFDRMAHAPPRTTQRMNSNGQSVEVLSSELEPGDRIRVVAGETLSVDGCIEDGCSSFDESLLTGEAIPVERGRGDKVIAGAVNTGQPVIVEVSHRVSASTLQEIQRLIEKGVRSKPEYAIITEIVARWFVTGVLLIAAVTAVTWFYVDPDVWLHNTIAVLIVTCPCALALATPVSLAITAGQLVHSGVLPANMKALDTITHCDIAVFDKTGTLTQGRPVITDIIPVGQRSRDEAMAITNSLSRVCNHPLSHAFNDIDDETLEVNEARSQPGRGVNAIIEGRRWYFGKYHQELAATDACLQAIEMLTANNRIVSVLADSEHGVQAVFGFNDEPRQGVSKLIQQLEQAGIQRFVILSGDTQHNVSVLAEQFGITEAHGDMLPQGKLDWIRRQQQQGHRIIMMGDGINDAPVLAAADVSFSFSEASDLANLNSDMVLLGHDPLGMSRTIRIAKATRRNIIQNMSWAICYNLVAIPLAVVGQIPPWGAAIGMSLSSALVVLNALRLQKQ